MFKTHRLCSHNFKLNYNYLQKQYSKERLRFARVKSGRLCRIHRIAGSFSELLVLQRSPGEERCQSQVLTIPIDNYFGWKKFCSLNITIILTFPIRIENNSTVVILYFCDYSPSMFPIIFFFSMATQPPTKLVLFYNQLQRFMTEGSTMSKRWIQFIFSCSIFY